MSQHSIPNGRVTVPSILARKGKEKIACLTAYDFCQAEIVDESGVDIILVGDSAGSVIQGNRTTLPVTMDEMIYHCRCVARGVKHGLIVGDMPFLSYQSSERDALINAGRFLKEGGVGAVKLEGGVAIASIIARLVAVDIPVMGHIGLTPQSYHRMGGFRVQGIHNRAKILDDAKAVEAAGAFSMVIEGVPDDLAQEITALVKIPTIGIGAGAGCDGQVLVFHDALGLIASKPAKFVKQYASLRPIALEGLRRFTNEVKLGTFPSAEYSYGESSKG